MGAGTWTRWQLCAFLADVRSNTSDIPRSITKKSGVKSNIKPPPPPATLILDTHTFDDVVLVSARRVFVGPRANGLAGR